MLRVCEWCQCEFSLTEDEWTCYRFCCAGCRQEDGRYWALKDLVRRRELKEMPAWLLEPVSPPAGEEV